MTRRSGLFRWLAVLSVGVLVAGCTPEVSTPEGGVSPTLVPSPTAYSPTPTPFPTPTPTPSISADLSLHDLLSSSLVYVDGQWRLGCDDGGCVVDEYASGYQIEVLGAVDFTYINAFPGATEDGMFRSKMVKAILRTDGGEIGIYLPLSYFRNAGTLEDLGDTKIELPPVNDFSTWLGMLGKRFPISEVDLKTDELIYSYYSDGYESASIDNGNLFAHFLIPSGIPRTPLEGEGIVFISVDNPGNNDDFSGFVVDDDLNTEIVDMLPQVEHLDDYIKLRYGFISQIDSYLEEVFHDVTSNSSLDDTYLFDFKTTSEGTIIAYDIEGDEFIKLFENVYVRPNYRIDDEGTDDGSDDDCFFASEYYILYETENGGKFFELLSYNLDSLDPDHNKRLDEESPLYLFLHPDKEYQHLKGSIVLSETSYNPMSPFYDASIIVLNFNDLSKDNYFPTHRAFILPYHYYVSSLSHLIGAVPPELFYYSKEDLNEWVNVVGINTMGDRYFLYPEIADNSDFLEFTYSPASYDDEYPKEIHIDGNSYSSVVKYEYSTYRLDISIASHNNITFGNLNDYVQNEEKSDDKYVNEIFLIIDTYGILSNYDTYLESQNPNLVIFLTPNAENILTECDRNDISYVGASVTDRNDRYGGYYFYPENVASEIFIFDTIDYSLIAGERVEEGAYVYVDRTINQSGVPTIRTFIKSNSKNDFYYLMPSLYGNFRYSPLGR